MDVVLNINVLCVFSMFSKLMSQASQFAMEGVKNLVVKKHVSWYTWSHQYHKPVSTCVRLSGIDTRYQFMSNVRCLCTETASYKDCGCVDGIKVYGWSGRLSVFWSETTSSCRQV